MTRIIVQPTGSPGAREHYRDTIASPVPFEDFAGVVGEDLRALAEVFPSGEAAIWGVTPGRSNVTKWERIEVGDLVLFAAKKTLFARGVVRHKFHNVAFAEALWGRDEEARTWEYMYAVDEVRTLDLTYVTLNRAVGYAENNVFQGFQVLDEEKSARAFAVISFDGDVPVEPEPEAVPGKSTAGLNSSWEELIGQLMTREQRRAKYGGALYGGIEPSAQTPNVFLYSDPNKSATYGYNFDGWSKNEPDVYLYTGEGRVGDMSMNDGNRAVRDHRAQERALRLFVFDDYVSGTKQAMSRYVGEFEVDKEYPFTTERTSDETGAERDAFVFRLHPVGEVAHQSVHESHHSTLLPVSRAINRTIRPRPPREVPDLLGELDVARMTTSRKEQGVLRELLVEGTNAADCALCGMTYPVEFLVAAHIKKRAECSEAEKRDIPANAMLACRFGCDELFERGFVGVAESGQILINTNMTITEDLRLRLDEFEDLECSVLAKSNEGYFRWHREKWFSSLRP